MAPQKPIHQIRKDLTEPIVRYVQEPAARPLVYAFKHTPVTPNQITALSALLAIGAAYLFSLGEAWALIQGGIIFEISLILDSVDGGLARAKGMVSEWGRIVDGIGDYVSGIAVLIGLMIGIPESRGELIVLAILIFLRGVTFDYFKEYMMSRITNGYDGPGRDIRKTVETLTRSPAWIHKIYFYYLQLQQLLFRSRWSSLKQYASTRQADSGEDVWQEEQRLNFYRKKRPLIVLWKWNGPDLIFFLIALFACFASLEHSIRWLSGFMLAQMVVTFIFHHYMIRYEKDS